MGPIGLAHLLILLSQLTIKKSIGRTICLFDWSTSIPMYVNNKYMTKDQIRWSAKVNGMAINLMSMFWIVFQKLAESETCSLCWNYTNKACVQNKRLRMCRLFAMRYSGTSDNGVYTNTTLCIKNTPYKGPVSRYTFWTSNLSMLHGPVIWRFHCLITQNLIMTIISTPLHSYTVVIDWNVIAILLLQNSPVPLHMAFLYPIAYNALHGDV